jgi:DNA-binding SARP family transcriptional activator
MKVVHKNLKAIENKGDWLDKAKEFERKGEIENAVDSYEKVIKKDPLNEYAYDRLMIIHRKNKEYKREKAVIISGIKAFQQFYGTALKRPATKKITTLSNALLKATGLADKKGRPLYEREPLGRWSKRKQVVEKKMKP